MTSAGVGPLDLAGEIAADLRGALAQHATRVKLAKDLSLEALVTSPELGGFQPSPPQLALIRAADGTRLDGLLTDAQMLSRVEFDGEERVRAAYAHGKGVVFVTGHFGYWELQALVHALRLRPMSVMARALDNPYLHRLLEEMRTRTGNGVIYRQGTLRRALRVLQEGGSIGVLIDQHIQSKDAISVDFFDRPAATTPIVAALALRTGARIVPLFALPLGHGRYRMVYEHSIEPPAADAEDPIRELTQRCTDVLEMYVRRHPHLWLWMHRRWREPQGGTTIPDTPMFPAGAPEEVKAEE